MSVLRASLFGKFQVQSGDQVLTSLNARKVQELFCYLLLYRDRPHPREALADLLWGGSPTVHSRKYLRQVLWQLQAALDPQSEVTNSRLLLVEPNWVQFNTEADFWLDVAVFEQAFAPVQGVPGRELDAQQAQPLQAAAHLYQGDLLEGWYQDWCLFERERLQSMYLAMLEKLMAYCEVHGKCEAGLAYGACVLRYDVAHERTHRRLMRLHYLASNRTAALRQYERCVAALREELDVGPSERTVALYEQIRSDRLVSPGQGMPEGDESIFEGMASTLSHALCHLKLLQTAFAESQRQLRQAIQTVEIALNGQS
jgi:DNA-binding SARP family transcriptional activator